MPEPVETRCVRAGVAHRRVQLHARHLALSLCGFIGSDLAFFAGRNTVTVWFTLAMAYLWFRETLCHYRLMREAQWERDNATEAREPGLNP